MIRINYTALGPVVAIDTPPLTSHVPRNERPALLSWRPTLERTCRCHGVRWGDVKAGYGGDKIVACRHEIWWRLREEFGASYPEIGRRTGGFHHTTVLAAVRAYERKAA